MHPSPIRGSHASQLKRGRPLSPAAIPFQPSRKTHVIRRLEIPSNHVPSRLECLPTEILEVIFLHALNISLPRASLQLGRKLSSDYVHRELLLRTCSDQVEENDLNKESLRQLPNEDNSDTQSTILRQKWFTLEFVRRLIPDYMTSVLLHQLSAHSLHWLSPEGPLVTPELEPVIHSYITNLMAKSLQYDTDPSFNHYFETQWTELNPSHRIVIVLGLSPREGLITLHIKDHDPFYLAFTANDNDTTKPRNSFSRSRILSLSPRTQIPPRLLHGPWYPRKIELLELLVRGNASINWITTTSGETAHQGFDDAIYEVNPRALHALCVPRNETTPGERKDVAYTVVPTRGVGVVPEQSHLLTAIRMGCREEIMEILVNAPESRVDLQRADVLPLLIAMHGQGHPQAGWLRDRIERDRVRRAAVFEPGRRHPLVGKRADDYLRTNLYASGR